MKTYKSLLTTVMLLAMTGNILAQDVKWDKEKYPDYNPTPHVDQAQLTRMKKRLQLQAAQGKQRPDHWNNALSTAFPPVMNQSAGSCGSASRIYYMFAHEMNAARWADGSKAENIYPTHFTWLLTWTGDNSHSQGKEMIAQFNGVPNSEVYGGYTYSDVFGYQDCDDGQSNYGWMQGYDKWFHAMNNRITGTANFAQALNTEEGREMVKNYLWNHCGDESYSTGGIVGVGVASGLTSGTIAKTTANTAAGVVGMKYVKYWGTSIDHALTIVGYDDRIEFDLDGNGKYGEKEKDEVGAWIIVNSWGSGWMNKGFIYCPYAEARPTKDGTSYWAPEYYTPRRDYRPLRTLKVKMDYDHRSEIALFVGVSSNLNATKADKEIWLRHFYYSGLGKGVTVSADNPDPAIPMLGRWADGNLHSEPMEFGYDITDLVSGYDNGQPLKYFFRVETRAWAQGTGKIYNASIIDYTTDREGVEIPFEIVEGGKEIANKGAKTTITTAARYENIPAPQNLNVNGTTLTWEAPVGAPYDIRNYSIYQDGTLLTTVDATTLNATIGENGTYTVTATYQVGNSVFESQPSSPILIGSAASPTEDTYMSLTDGHFTVPAFTTGGLTEYTIEFWLKPESFAEKSFGIKASTGKFLFYVNANKKVVVGFDGGDFTTSTTSLTTDWQHIAIVVKNSNITVYRTTTAATTSTINAIINWNSGWSNSGINGNNDLMFGKTEGTGSGSSDYKTVVDAPWNGLIDELRVWNYARTQSEIKSTVGDAYVLPGNYEKLTHYYMMNTRERADGTLMLVDSKGKNDAALGSGQFTPGTIALNETSKHPHRVMSSTAKFSLSITKPVVGQPVTIIDGSSPSTSQWSWTFTGAEPATSHVSRPVVVFNQAGEQTIELTTTNLKGETKSTSKTITVVEAEKPVADFRLPSGPIAAGQHVTFINTSTPLDDASYTWTLDGAAITTLNTMNATATYLANGTYTVRLEARNAAGYSVVEKQVEVVKVAPEAAFNIQNNVAIVNEPINIIDASKYEPESWEWMIRNDNHTFLVKTRSGSIKMDKPGIYDVTLKVGNDMGSNSLTRQRAITVCNADGQTGLNFDNLDDELSAASPGVALNVTIEWWMYPGSISNTCLKMGDSESTFLLTTESDRSMKATVKGKVAQSLASYVLENEWHHYAVTYSYSKATVSFYRDGVLYNSVTNAGKNSTKWASFKMGGADAPMNAIVDELRIWNKVMTVDEIRQVANSPIANPADEEKLVLYYDFNQSTGDVIDRSASNLTGTRTNFGPDGDAWTSSRGIFFLDFDSEAKDVTATYLKNYMAPFTTGSGYINPSGGTRFKKMGAPWTQENSVVKDNITTEFHVDANKNNYMTLSTSWDGFASEVKNLKIYQTVTLPAGAYEFGTWTDKEAQLGANYLVAAAGTGFPDFTELADQALGYSPSNATCKFILSEETPVSLGILSMMSGQACHTVKQFALSMSPVIELKAGEIYDAIEGVTEEVNAEPTLQAFGGLGTIRVAVSEPQEVVVVALNGAVIWQGFVVKQATIPARKGLYIVNHQKIIVR